MLSKPYIVQPRALRSLIFNIAHTEGLIACVCGTATHVGVDAERVRLDLSLMDIAERYFADAELAELRALPPLLRVQRYFQYWTLKEAYLKAIGTGLSIPLDQVRFGLGSEGISMELTGASSHTALDWHTWLLRPSVTHIAAICVGGNVGERYELAARRTIPLVSEQPLEHALISRSHLKPNELAVN